MKHGDFAVTWNDILGVEDFSDISFDEFVQIFRDKTATTMKSITCVPELVHAVLMSFNHSFRLWMIETGHAIICFVPSSHSMTNDVQRHVDPSQQSWRYWFTGSTRFELEDSKVLAGKMTTRYLRMAEWHAALGRQLKPVKACGATSFPVSLKDCCIELTSCNCVILFRYCRKE